MSRLVIVRIGRPWSSRIAPSDQPIEVRRHYQRPADPHELGDRGWDLKMTIIELTLDDPAERWLAERVEDEIGGYPDLLLRSGAGNL